MSVTDYFLVYLSLVMMMAAGGLWLRETRVEALKIARPPALHRQNRRL